MSLLTATLAEVNAQILDIGQAVIHEDLALGILVRVDSVHAGNIIKEIMFNANAAGASVRISNVSQENHRLWVEASGKPRYILTLLTAGDGSAALHEASALTHKVGLNIDTVRRLTDRGAKVRADVPSRLCVEMRMRGAATDLEHLRVELIASAERLNFDFSIQQDTVFRRNRRLVAFDMDSTLIMEEVIDELAVRHGVGG